MGYSSGMLKERIKVLNLSGAENGDFGRKAKTYTESCTIWAAVDFTHGIKAMREGALDAYDTVMIRCRYCTSLNRNSRIEHKGKTYKIESFHADEGENTIQITAMELING